MEILEHIHFFINGSCLCSESRPIVSHYQNQSMFSVSLSHIEMSEKPRPPTPAPSVKKGGSFHLNKKGHNLIQLKKYGRKHQEYKKEYRKRKLLRSHMDSIQ